MAGNRRVGIALRVRLPFPAGRVGVTCADVLCLQAFEFLLCAKLVGLRKVSVNHEAHVTSIVPFWCQRAILVQAVRFCVYQGVGSLGFRANRCGAIVVRATFWICSREHLSCSGSRAPA